MLNRHCVEFWEQSKKYLTGVEYGQNRVLLMAIGRQNEGFTVKIGQKDGLNSIFAFHPIFDPMGIRHACALPKNWECQELNSG